MDRTEIYDDLRELIHEARERWSGLSKRDVIEDMRGELADRLIENGHDADEVDLVIESEVRRLRGNAAP